MTDQTEPLEHVHRLDDSAAPEGEGKTPNGKRVVRAKSLKKRTRSHKPKPANPKRRLNWRYHLREKLPELRYYLFRKPYNLGLSDTIELAYMLGDPFEEAYFFLKRALRYLGEEFALRTIEMAMTMTYEQTALLPLHDHQRLYRLEIFKALLKKKLSWKKYVRLVGTKVHFEQDALPFFVKTLEETSPEGIEHLRRTLEYTGLPFCYDMLHKALEIQRRGGLMTNDMKRQRTLAGVFFQVVRANSTPYIYRELFPYMLKHPIKQRDPMKGWVHPADVLTPPAERAKLIKEARKSPGRVTYMKISMKGIPGIVKRNSSLVIVTMTFDTRVPNLPSGVPKLGNKSQFLVYISGSHWKRLGDYVDNPNNEIMIEGYPRYDAEAGIIAVHAYKVKPALKGKRPPRKMYINRPVPVPPNTELPDDMPLTAIVSADIQSTMTTPPKHDKARKASDPVSPAMGELELPPLPPKVEVELPPNLTKEEKIAYLEATLGELHERIKVVRNLPLSQRGELVQLVRKQLAFQKELFTLIPAPPLNKDVKPGTPKPT